MSDSPLKENAYWKDKLSSEEFRICREKGTERAFTGAYYDKKDAGVYRCKCCQHPLFGSSSKYDSGSGWPSFFTPLRTEDVEQVSDHSHGMTRTEVMCDKCGSHLGHVFPDGPQPTGLRYCINSASLNFEASSDAVED